MLRETCTSFAMYPLMRAARVLSKRFTCRSGDVCLCCCLGVSGHSPQKPVCISSRCCLHGPSLEESVHRCFCSRPLHNRPKQRGSLRWGRVGVCLWLLTSFAPGHAWALTLRPHDPLSPSRSWARPGPPDLLECLDTVRRFSCTGGGGAPGGAACPRTAMAWAGGAGGPLWIAAGGF